MTEILTTTLVSSTWKNFVGNSPTCMRKIDLTINGRKYFLNHRENELKRELKMIKNRGRRYENFTLYGQRPGFLTKDVIGLLRSRRGKWKNIKIWSEKFEDENQLREILIEIAENVENLELRNIYFVTSVKSCEAPQTFNFTKLKKLTLCNVTNIQWVFKTLEKCHRLDSLEIESENNEELFKFLKKTTRIRKLSLTEQIWNDDWFLQLSQLKLKLFEFKLKILTADCHMLQNYFKIFLETQADCLGRLIIDATLSYETLESIYRLPNLKSLHLKTSTNAPRLCLPTNYSIINLVLSFRCEESIFIWLISALPNLQTLKICSVDQSVIETARKKLPNLTSIDNS